VRNRRLSDIFTRNTHLVLALLMRDLHAKTRTSSRHVHHFPQRSSLRTAFVSRLIENRCHAAFFPQRAFRPLSKANCYHHSVLCRKPCCDISVLDVRPCGQFACSGRPCGQLVSNLPCSVRPRGQQPETEIFTNFRKKPKLSVNPWRCSFGVVFSAHSCLECKLLSRFRRKKCLMLHQNYTPGSRTPDVSPASTPESLAHPWHRHRPPSRLPTRRHSSLLPASTRATDYFRRVRKR